MVGARTAAHRRPLGRTRCGCGGAAAVGAVVHGCQFANVAAIGRLRADGDVARHSDRGRPQDRHQRGLSLGSRRLWWPESVCLAVRGSPRRPLARAVFPGRPCVVGIRVDVLLLRISGSLAPRRALGARGVHLPSASRSRSGRKHAARTFSRTTSQAPPSSGSCSSGSMPGIGGKPIDGERSGARSRSERPLHAAIHEIESLDVLGPAHAVTLRVVHT